jgi:hypothetical protein
LFFAGNPEKEAVILAGEGEWVRWPTGRQLVVRYQYSSARDRNLWIDDLKMEAAFSKDTVAPALLACRFPEERLLLIEFSESPAKISGDCFRLGQQEGKVWEITECSQDASQVLLRFSEEIPNRAELTLQLSGVCDPDGNCMEDTMIFLRRNDAVWGDVVFTELMADPEPGVGLPEQEYIELYNRSMDTVDLNDWYCRVDSRDHHLSGAHLWDGGKLAPGAFGLLRGITLPNAGALLSLYSSRNVLIHAARYSLPWNGAAWKQEGGWSLESPDPERICTLSDLWGFSEDVSGGTPGEVNSLDREVADNEPPLMLYTGFDEATSLFSLHFTEPVDCSHWTPRQFLLLPGNVMPDSVAPGFPLSDRVDLWLPGAFGKRTEFSVQLPILVDCSGNLCYTGKANGGAAVVPAPGGVVINEVMFDPEEGHPEFVELYNPGTRFQDLHNLCLDAVNRGALPDRPVPISLNSRLLPPGAYVVLAEHAEQLREAYGPEASGKWIGVEPWPSLNDGGGTLYLTDRAGQTVDLMHFSEELHMELLDQLSGISLERIDPGLPGQDPANWHSAASIAGYATPGNQNSQWREDVEGEKVLQVRPRVFSPDNDGFEDVLEITFSPQGIGWIFSLWISDMEGRQVRVMANNHVAGTVSVYRWDGEQTDGWMAPEGLYILHAGGYHEATGKTWRKRLAVGLTYR